MKYPVCTSFLVIFASCAKCLFLNFLGLLFVFIFMLFLFGGWGFLILIGWSGGVSQDRLLPRSTKRNAYVGIIRYPHHPLPSHLGTYALVRMPTLLRYIRMQIFSLALTSLSLCILFHTIIPNQYRHAPATTNGLKDIWDDSSNGSVNGRRNRSGPLLSQIDLGNRVR
jgi:hypothetical protein